MVWEEATIVRRRMNQHWRTQATVTLMASATAQKGGKAATAAFNKFLEKFTDGEDH
jgi:hypothetical protein